MANIAEFVRLPKDIDGNEFIINVKYITGMRDYHQNGQNCVVLYVDLAHGGTGKGKCIYIRGWTSNTMFNDVFKRLEVV